MTTRTSALALSLLLLGCSSTPDDDDTRNTSSSAGATSTAGAGGTAGAGAGGAGNGGTVGFSGNAGTSATAGSAGASAGDGGAAGNNAAGDGGAAGNNAAGNAGGGAGNAGESGAAGEGGQGGEAGVGGSSGTGGAGGAPAGAGGTGGATGGAAGTAGGGAVACPVTLDASISACIQDRLADPELSPQEFLLDTLLACADAEPVADDWDAHCAATPGDPACALDYPSFVQEVLPGCVARVQTALFEGRCVLPSRYRDVRFTRAMSPLDRQVLTSPAGLDEVERAQIIAAGRVANPDLATAEAVFSHADEGLLTREEWLELGTYRRLVSYVFHAGDNLFGAFFFDGTPTRVARIYDGDILDCAVEQVPRMSPCASQDACQAGLSCQGIVEVAGKVAGEGLCVATTPAEGEGSSCKGPDSCDASVGLVCLDLGAPPGEGDGQCRPGWQRGRFAGVPAELSQGSTTHELEQIVSGLATVATAVRVNAVISHPSPSTVRVWVRNPASSEALVFDGAKQQAPNGEISLENVPVPTPGDESVNGVWKLLIEDPSASGGSVLFWDLEISSRFD